MNNDTPYLKIVWIIYLKHRIFFISWPKFYVAVLLVSQIQILHCESFSTYPSNNNRTVMWLNCTVDDDTVAIEDTGILHTVTLHITIERGFWMANVIPIEV